MFEHEGMSYATLEEKARVMKFYRKGKNNYCYYCFMSTIATKGLRGESAHFNINSLFFTAKIVNFNGSSVKIMSIINITQENLDS